MTYCIKFISGYLRCFGVGFFVVMPFVIKSYNILLCFPALGFIL